MILQTNCSEATMRVRIDDLTEEETSQIISMLEKFDAVVNGEPLYSNLIDENEKLGGETLLEGLSAEEIQEIKDSWWDTSFAIETIFDMRVIVIRGATPFNKYTWLESKIKSFPFSSKLVIDWSEP